jgi:hypothetical protein
MDAGLLFRKEKHEIDNCLLARDDPSMIFDRWALWLFGLMG